MQEKKNRQNSLIVQDRFVFFVTGVFPSMTLVALIKVVLLISYSSMKKKTGMIRMIFDIGN